MLFAGRPLRKHVFETPRTDVGGPLEDVLAGSNSRSYVRTRRRMREGIAMFTVQNDWITYEEAVEPVAVRRVAVRGGAACAQRLPVARDPRAVPAPQRAAARSTSAPVTPRGTGAAPTAARRAPVTRSRLRLTRRGRVVLMVLPTLLALSGVLLASAPGVAEASPRVEPARTVVVGTGDSLWTIAERVAPHTDPRLTVAALERANGLTDGRVAAGATLVLPLP
jgi:hypothetical protein